MSDTQHDAAPETEKTVDQAQSDATASRISQEAQSASGGTTEKSKVGIMKDGLEVAGKLLLGLAGLCYVLGLMVVPLHLSPYGLNSLDLPQVSYAIAGMWAVLPIVLVVMSIVFASFLVSSVFEKKTKEHWVNWWVDILAVITAVPVLLTLVFGFLIRSVGIEFGWKNWVGFPVLGTVAVLITLTAVYRLGRLTNRDSFGELLLTLGVLVFGSMLFLVYVILFSTHTYESIPWSAGGGRPSAVRLFIAQDSKPYLESLRVPLTAEQNKKELLETSPIKLLLSTDKQLVVVNSDGKAVSLPSETVKWVTYEK